MKKIKVSREDRSLIEAFMGLPEMDLPEWMDWNQTMEIVEYIERLPGKSPHGYGYEWNVLGSRCVAFIGRGRREDIVVKGLVDYSEESPRYRSRLEATLECITDFIRWYTIESSPSIPS